MHAKWMVQQQCPCLLIPNKSNPKISLANNFFLKKNAFVLDLTINILKLTNLKRKSLLSLRIVANGIKLFTIH